MSHVDDHGEFVTAQDKRRPVRPRPPWHFRLAKWLIRAGRWGGYHLVELGEWLGWLNHDVRFNLGRGVALDVPMDRRPNQWAEPDLRNYERQLIDTLASGAETLEAPVRWIDVGADIGAVTALVVSRAARVAEAHLFEPNPVAFAYLARNARQLPIPAVARAAAVGSRPGRGELRHSPTDSSDHARFLAAADEGELEVVALDQLFDWHAGSVLMKIDVEGGEWDVLRGAERLLRELPEWLIAFEAHVGVCQRQGIDPSEIVRWLRSWRPVEAWVAELGPERAIDWNRPYFEQLEPRRAVSNVVCRARRA